MFSVCSTWMFLCWESWFPDCVICSRVESAWAPRYTHTLARTQSQISVSGRCFLCLFATSCYCLLHPSPFLCVGPHLPSVYLKMCYARSVFSRWSGLFKGGCASVIVSLTVQCPQDLTPYSGTAHRLQLAPVMCIHAVVPMKS